MMRYLLIGLLCLLTVGDVIIPQTSSAKVEYALRIATLAPSNTPIGRAYQRLNRDLMEASGGTTSVRLYSGGAAGDEKTIVRKMRVGQLDGALITAEGLGALLPQVLVLQAPGLITSYAEIDRVRTRLAPEFAKLFEQAGYYLISWGDAGRIRIFSTHEVVRPKDLHSRRPWTWRDSPTMKAFIKATGANGVLLGVPEVYPALQTGMVDTVIASSIAVLGFQWHTRLRTMSRQSNGVVVGAFVIRKDKVDALPESARKFIFDSANKTEEEFRVLGRRLDNQATKALSKRLKLTDLEPYKSAWDAAARRARESLTGRVYSNALLSRVGAIVSEP